VEVCGFAAIGIIIARSAIKMSLRIIQKDFYKDSFRE
jgi:hypothetical protein